MATEDEAMPVVARINVAPVKSLGLEHPEAIDLDERGARDDRRFFQLSEGRLIGGVRHGPLVRVRPAWDPVARTLGLTFPNGTTVDGEVALGAAVTADFWGRTVRGRLVEGPWGDALSDYASASVQLVERDHENHATDMRPATMVSRASVERLGAGDARRFRMLLDLEGLEPFEEDTWRDRHVQMGGALLRVGGPVPRCAVTTQDPDTGVREYDTLRAIRDLRGVREDDGKSLDCGVYAEVVEPGRVRVGDAVTLVS